MLSFIFIGIGCVILALVVGLLRARRVSGKVGEKYVSKVLNRYVEECGGYVINDVILPYGNRTSQIDHILFSTAGVFVIETKDWGGWIYGKDFDNYWTQTIGIKRIQKHQHYNPVKQNNVHVKAVKVHTKEYDKGKFYNLVVFAKNNTEHIQSDYVIGIGGLLDLLKSIKEKRYTLPKLKEMYDCINYYVEHPVSTHEQHVRSVRHDHPGI